MGGVKESEWLSPQTVKAEAKGRAEVAGDSTSGGVYSQSSPAHNLYCILQHLQRLSLLEET